MKYSDDQLISRVESHAKGFEGWRKGLYLIAVRSNADVTDAFDDKAYLFDCKEDGKEPVFEMVATCTTNAGSDGLKNFDKKYNLPGCAVLEADRIVYESHRKDKHKGYVAYKQFKSFPYYRDSDRDGKAEQLGPVKEGVIAANIHRANPNKTSALNYNWSIGCVVMNDPSQFNAFMARCAGRPVSLCILQQF